jgi:tetratricopeptide (TPR) repeat protein
MHLDWLWSKLFSKTPSAAEIWYRNGNSYYREMKYKQALAAYNHLQSKMPYLRKALYRKALTLSKLRRRRQAERTFKLAIEGEPYDTGVDVIIDYSTTESRRWAIAEADRRLREYPRDSSIWYHKGVMHANQGEYQEASDCMDRTIAIEENLEHTYPQVMMKAWRLKGTCLYLLHQSQDAEKCFDKFIALEDISIEFEMAAYFENKTEFEKALDAIDSILRIDAYNTRALNDKATYLIKLERTDDARKCLEKYEDLQSANPRYWYHRGISLSVHGLHEQAIPFLNKAIKLDPRFASAWYSKAGCLAGLGRHKEAILCYSKALKLSPKSFVIWYEKGISHVALGQKYLASRCFDKVLAIEPGHELASKGKARLDRLARR